MQIETNKLGLTINDYKCGKCGYLHARSFVENHPIKRCYRCQTPMENKINGKPQKTS